MANDSLFIEEGGFGCVVLLQVLGLLLVVEGLQCFLRLALFYECGTGLGLGHAKAFEPFAVPVERALGVGAVGSVAA